MDLGRQNVPYCNRVNPISKFAKLLIRVSMELHQSDVANICLLLSVDKMVKQRVLTNLRDPAEVLQHLNKINLVTAHEVDYLEDILLNIRREDISLYVKEYKLHLCSKLSTDEMDKSTTNDLLAAGAAAEHEESMSSQDGADCLQGSSQMSVESEGEEAMSCSQNSISDDEKLLKFENKLCQSDVLQ